MRKRSKAQPVSDIPTEPSHGQLGSLLRRLGWSVVGGALIALGGLLGAWGLGLGSHGYKRLAALHGPKEENPRAYFKLAGLGLLPAFMHSAPNGFFGMGVTGIEGRVGGRQPLSIGLAGEALVLVGNAIGAAAVAMTAILAGLPRWREGFLGQVMLNLARSILDQPLATSVTGGLTAGALMWVVVQGNRAPWSGLASHLSGLLTGLALLALVVIGLWHATVATFFFVAGFLIKLLAPAAFWVSIGSAPEAYVDLTPATFLVRGLLPIALANLAGVVAVDVIARRVRASRRPG